MHYPQRLIKAMVGVVLIGGALASCQSEPRGFRQGPPRSDQPWPWLVRSGDDNPIPTPPPPFPSPSPSSPPGEFVFTAPNLRLYQRGQIAQPIPTPPPPLPSPSPVPKPPFPFPRLDQERASSFDPLPYRIALSAFLNSVQGVGGLPIQQGVVLMDPAGYPLVAHQPLRDFPVSSLSQLATSLIALETWGGQHRFETRVYAEGELRDQQLIGHLWIEGGFDPHFTIQDAQSLSRQLQNLGIREIAGGLRITGPFFMEDRQDPSMSGRLLQSHLSPVWIRDSLQSGQDYPSTGQVLVRHASMPLQDILKIAHTRNSQIEIDRLMLALGGVEQVKSTLDRSVQLSSSQIQLQGGSDRLSPLAVAQILAGLRDQVGSLASVLPEAGVDSGWVNQRGLPLGTVAAVGMDHPHVVALAGQLPNGVIFVLLNQGSDSDGIARLQARFLRDVMMLQDLGQDQ